MRWRGPLCAAALIIPLTGCAGGAVEVAAPERADDPACRSVPWPQSLGDLPRRETTGGTAVAAWGDPAVIARCGLPTQGPTTLECVAVNDVDWVLRELSDGYGFVTYGTDPALEVLVPAAYAPETMLLTDFTALAAALPGTGRSCIAPS